MPNLLHSSMRKPVFACAANARHAPSDGHSFVRMLVAAAFLAAVSLLIIVIGAATVQSQTGNDLSDYTAAVAQPVRAERLKALDTYVRGASGPFRLEGITYLAWEYLQVGERSRAVQWARQLLLADTENGFALALVADDSRSGTLDKHAAQKLVADTNRGLASLPRLQRPLGMPANDFAHLRQVSQAMLKGAAGEAEFSRRNYFAARNDLRDALALAPDDPRDTYTLARAYLGGKGANPKEGYWYLARAVNLTQGTAEGAKIAEYARNRYMQDGGTSTAWDQFLVTARFPAKPATTEMAKTQPALTPAPVPTTNTSTTASVKPPPATAEAAKTNPEATIWADNTPPRYPIRRKRLTASSNGPVSLGILIETALTAKENRAALINSLTDMVRRLGENDEAFILSYSDNLMFEEDLTGDTNQLENALENIKPERGAALDDAVAFAAGHLARIAKNPRRELLVISDGSNVDSRNTPLRTLAAINNAGVRIYCIGMDVNQIDGRYRLQALSSSTGGHSSFVSSPQQLRQATIEIARNMGIDFRF